MLDTNTLSYLVQSHPVVVRRVVAVPMAALCMSSITEAELLFGLAKRPAAKRLHAIVRELLQRVDVLPWDHAAAERYGITRADLVRNGKILAPLDLLIPTTTTNDSAHCSPSRTVVRRHKKRWSSGTSIYLSCSLYIYQEEMEQLYVYLASPTFSQRIRSVFDFLAAALPRVI